MSYQCSFCPDTELIHGAMISGFTSGDVPKTDCNMYCCHQCNSNFFYKELKLIGWSFKKNYCGNEYYVTWFEENDQTVLRKNWKLVTSFRGQIKITPYNLDQKLPTILTFL